MAGLTGRHAGSLADELAEPTEQNVERIVLDLVALERIDHAGVRTILLAWLRAGDRRGELLSSRPGFVQSLIDDVHRLFRYIMRAPVSLVAMPGAATGVTPASRRPRATASAAREGAGGSR